MPELVEVEKLVRQLRPALVGRRLDYYESLHTNPSGAPIAQHFLRRNSLAEWDEHVLGSTIESLGRVGKNLIFRLSSGWMLQLHLNSTGWIVAGNELAARSTEINPSHEAFIYTAVAKEPLKHAMVGWVFDDGQVWYYVDPRTWGRMYLWPTHDIKLAGDLKTYGPDWLEAPYRATHKLVNWRPQSNRTVKEVLLDQKITSGVGNYIVCELLHRVGLHPHTPWSTLTDQQKGRLADLAVTWMPYALSVTNHDHWMVFGKRHEPCRKPTCPGTISYSKDGPNEQRGSYFCDSCQPLSLVGSVATAGLYYQHVVPPAPHK